MLTINPTDIRKRILELAFLSGKAGSHIGGSLSLVEILCVLYNDALSVSKTTDFCSRDRVILSKGHGAMALYCILEKIGLIEKSELDNFEHNGAKYYAHAKRDVAKGIEFSGGSLSLGLSFATGIALSCKQKGIDNHIYVILGDGECDEGLVWESAMSISNYHLSNMTLIVDKNGLQSDGCTNLVMDSSSLSEKFQSFGFDAAEVDGHSIPELLNVFSYRNPDKPNAVIAHTIKGKGISFMENQRQWHHGVLSEQLYLSAMEEITNGKI